MKNPFSTVVKDYVTTSLCHLKGDTRLYEFNPTVRPERQIHAGVSLGIMVPDEDEIYNYHHVTTLWLN